MSKNQNQKNPYEDIIHLPHHVSPKRPQMSLRDRAAQFAPFAALTGHEDAVKEAARLTETKIQLDEDEKQLLDQKLQYLQNHLEDRTTVNITYFVPDRKKEGGKYLAHDGCIKKIKEFDALIIMEDGTEIPITDILQINLKTEG